MTGKALCCMFLLAIFGVDSAQNLAKYKKGGYVCSRGAVTSWLVRSFPEWAVRVRALAGDTVCVAFLGKTLNSHSASLHPGVLMGTGILLEKPDKLQGNDLRWNSIPCRGSRNTPSFFVLQKSGISLISSGSYEPVGSKASFSFMRAHAASQQKNFDYLIRA